MLSKGIIQIHAERTQKLTEGQRACLRLVYDHKTSKAIARELGISPHTVDQRIKIAMRILHVDNRVDAAKALFDNTESDLYPNLVYQSPDIERAAPDAALTSSLDDGAEDDVAIALDTDQRRNIAELFVRSKATSYPLPSLPLPGEKHDLNPLQKIGWIFAIAIGSALSFGAVLAGLDALSRLG